MLELRDRIINNDKHQLLTRTCTKPNTSWLVHSWSIFGVKTNHKQIRIHKTHHGPDLGEATTLPPYSIFCAWPWTDIQMTFCSETPKVGTLANPHTPKWTHFGSWNLNRLPKFLRTISGVKTLWIENFVISLENVLNVDV
jgi:hypothetical protein